MFDIVYKAGNLVELANTAAENGFNELIVLGLKKEEAKNLNPEPEAVLKKTEKHQKKKKNSIKIISALFVEQKDFSRIPKLEKEYEIIMARGSRQAFESKQVKLIVPDTDYPKDHTHYRNSGIDQILAKIAKQKNKTIIFDFSELLNSSKKQLVLGRWMQNARILKKYKVCFEICSLASQPTELKTAQDLKAMKRELL